MPFWHMHISSGLKHAQPVRKENKLQKQCPLTKHNIDISQASQQRRPFPNRKHTSATAIVVTVPILVYQATLVVAVAMRFRSINGPRVREAEHRQSCNMPWCRYGGRLGLTDRDPVPASWSPCALVRDQMNCRRKCIRLFQIWASLCSKLVVFFYPL